MDKKSKILITFFIFAIIVSIFFTYKRSFIDKNFEIIQEDTEESLDEEILDTSDVVETESITE